MHAGFVSPKTTDAVTKSLEDVANGLKSHKEVKTEGFQTPVKELHQSPIAAANTLNESETKFIKLQCIDAIKLKWADKSLIKQENVSAP